MHVSSHLGSFEGHMFQEVGCSIVGIVFVPTAGIYPDSHSSSFCERVCLRGHTQPTVKRCDLHSRTDDTPWSRMLMLCRLELLDDIYSGFVHRQLFWHNSKASAKLST